MNNLFFKTQTYLQAILGEVPAIKQSQLDVLPLYLRERYQFYQVKLFGRAWTLAIESPDWDMGTPSEYRQQVKTISKIVQDPLVLVLDSITSTVRNRMVRMSIPFIVPGTQVFLPIVFIDISENYATSLPEKGKRLSPTAQVILLYQIQWGHLEELSSKQIASKFGYSEMMISKARSELESNQLCEVTRKGKAIRMLFPDESAILWRRAEAYLSTPVRKRHWIQWDSPVTQAKVAGISALSILSNLAEDDVPTFALKRKDFQFLLERGQLRGCPDSHEAHAQIECWSYDPELLADGHRVDPLSLYLSLKEDHDERVQGELQTMMGVLGWL